MSPRSRLDALELARREPAGERAPVPAAEGGREVDLHLHLDRLVAGDVRMGTRGDENAPENPYYGLTLTCIFVKWWS